MACDRGVSNRPKLRHTLALRLAVGRINSGHPAPTEWLAGCVISKDKAQNKLDSERRCHELGQPNGMIDARWSLAEGDRIGTRTGGQGRRGSGMLRPEERRPKHPPLLGYLRGAVCGGAL